MAYFKKVDHYLFKKVLGRVIIFQSKGAFAIVYEATDERNQQTVAVKEIELDKFDISSDEGRKNRDYFDSEMEILKNLKHPNIINLIEVVQETRFIYMIFEHCVGDLQNFLKKQTAKGRMPEQETQVVYCQIIDAMKLLHQKQIVHRDLKLANILISQDQSVKIADFGFAKVKEQGLFQSYCGTPITMAPEILESNTYDSKCDIWSLGVILYQMLIGVAPFMPKEAKLENLIKLIKIADLQFPKDIPISDSVKGLLKLMLIPDPKQRISFEQLFKHPWVQSDQDNLEKSQQIIQRFQSFRTVNQNLDIATLISIDLRNKLTQRNQIIGYIEDVIPQLQGKLKEDSRELRKQLLKSKLNITLKTRSKTHQESEPEMEFTMTIAYWINNVCEQFLEQSKPPQLAQLWTLVKNAEFSTTVVICLEEEQDLEALMNDIQSQVTQDKQLIVQQPRKYQISFIQNLIQVTIDWIDILLN